MFKWDMCVFPSFPGVHEGDPPVAMLVGDRRLLLTNEKQRVHGLRVGEKLAAVRAVRGDTAATKLAKEKLTAAVKAEGCKGPNVFAILSYLNLQHLFVLPVAHALLYGVVAHFVADILRKPVTQQNSATSISMANHASSGMGGLAIGICCRTGQPLPVVNEVLTWGCLQK